MKHSLYVFTLFLVGFLGYTTSQDNIPTADEVLQKVAGLTNNADLFPSNFNTSGLPTLEDAKNLFEQKCNKNGGPDAFKNAAQAQADMEQCLKSLVNMTELYVEMEDAKPTGELDVVFRKYCRKSPILKACVTNFTNAIEPCLEEKERESKRVILNITDSLLSFVCHKEGDRIALFIAAGGIECLQAKQQEIQTCANNTFGTYVPTTDPLTGGLPGIEKLPTLVLGQKECRDMENFQTCAVRELEQCKDPTPGNVVDSILNFIKRVTPCEKYLHKASSGNSISSVNFLSTVLITLISLRFF